MKGRWLLWDQAALASRIGMDTWLDPIRYHAAKIPFSVDVSPRSGLYRRCAGGDERQGSAHWCLISTIHCGAG